MLSLAKAVKDYYLQKLGEISPREDYYLRGGAASGVWRGNGVAELDLAGTVNAEGLVRLFDGEHPGTGERLGRQLRKDGVAAWDVTFSADKSVSLLWALSDKETRRQVLEAFDKATTEAFEYLESVASSTRGASKTPVVNDNGDPVLNDNGTPRFRVETWPIPTAGFVAASFTEFTSRADDPQLHTHVVVANKVKGNDGIWRSIDGRLLYRHQLAAGYLHEAVLRRELTRRLGVRWQPVHNGMADIEGFTRHQIDVFSRRRHQLEEWRQEQGLPDTAAARQVAVLATRDPKQDRLLEDLEVEWWQRADQVGLTAKRVASVTGHSRDVTPADPLALFDRLASPDGLTAQASTFAKPEVVKEIAAAVPGGGTRGEIEALADMFLDTREVVPVLPGRDVESSDVVEDLTIGEPLGAVGVSRPMRQHNGKLFPGTANRQYTTVELLATEQRIIEQAIGGVAAGRWVVPDRFVQARLRRHRHLTDGQREMVRCFASSGNVFDIGIGPAGTGKTAVMAVISQLAALTGTPILGTALAARAAAGLETATGIRSTTLARLLGQTGDARGLAPGVVVVVDEAGMVGTRQLAAVSDLVNRAEGKLILIGDDHQLPEIDAGGLFRALASRLPTVRLTDNIRQEHSWERVALAELRNGSVDEAVEAYRQHRRLIIGQDRDDAIARAVRDWYRHVTVVGDLADGLLIATDNDTVAELNEQARSHLTVSRGLSGPTVDTGERTFQAGDRILCRRNQDRLDVLNGDLGTVVSVDPRQMTLTVRLDRDPETRELPGWYLTAGHADYGYALTGHKAQGVTTGRTFTIIAGGTNREWAYVAMSRGRQANTLYLANPAHGDEECTHFTHIGHHDALGGFAASLEHSHAQTAALDHPAGSPVSVDIDPLGPPPPSRDVAARVAWQIARRRTERNETEQQAPRLDLAAGR
ncbi:MAG: relaxase domain-containing protein [Acidobacteria bacterium]|nr:relaxase domain-containing protein [Acidobacteriota bacterium]